MPFSAWVGRFCLALVAAWLVLAAPGQAQQFPALTGRVVDGANIISPAKESALLGQLEALETNSTRQLVVATVPSLQGYEIEEFANGLFREWQLGQDGVGEAEKDNGVLLLVAPNERKVRIEVGYGLEGVMTDALASQIIQNDILPQFRNGDMEAGIQTGVDAIDRQLTLPEDEARAIADQALQSQSSDGGFDWFGMIFWGFIILFFIIIPAFSSKNGKRYRSGRGPVVVWGGPSSMGGSSWTSSGGGWSSGGGGGGFSGGGGSSGGGGASGGW